MSANSPNPGLFFYRICGLCVASEVALPGACQTQPLALPDVTIRRGLVPDSLPDARAGGPTWQIAGGRLLLSISGIARFLLTDGANIIFTPASEAAAADLPIFLMGTVFGVLLHQRGHIVLHASAVKVNGRAMLFCGSSGAGKSTLAAALGQRGYAVVTDDVCALTLSAAGAAMVHPDGRQLKLWEQAIKKLDLSEKRGMRVRPSLQKFYVEPEDAHPEPLPLGAVYCLREARPPLESGITIPNVVDAALLLRRNAYRPRLVSGMDQQAVYFHAAAAIADNAGIFHLTRPLDFSRLAETISWLEAHWRQLAETAA